MKRFQLLLASCALAISAAPTIADTLAPGYRASKLPNPAAGIFAVACTVSGGDLVTFDGDVVERYKPNGTFVGTLGTLASFGFPSFVVPTPDGTAVVIGESTNSGLHVAKLDGSGMTPLTTLALNYAADFSPSGDLFVSAASLGSGIGNLLWRITLSPFSQTQVGTLGGPSGPITFGANGDLYYATQDPNFPAGPGSTDVVRWTAAQVAGGAMTLANSTVFGADFDGGAALDFDAITGKLYLAEVNFGLAEYRIVRVISDKASSPVILESIDAITGVQVINNGGGAASFDAYQPSNGSNLRYVVTDFFSYNDVVTLRPQRPALSVSGPGTTGVGAVTLSLVDGVPNGTMFLLFCPQSLYSATETSYPNFPNFILHTGLAIAQSRRIPFLLPTDSNGAGSFTFWNPGNLIGAYAYQALVGDGAGAFVGASTSTLF